MEETKKIIEEVHIKRKDISKSKDIISKKIKNAVLNKQQKKKEYQSYYTAQKLLKNNRESQKSYNYFKAQKSINSKINTNRSLSVNSLNKHKEEKDSTKNKSKSKEKLNNLKLKEETQVKPETENSDFCYYNPKKENYPILVVRLVGENERIAKPQQEILKKFKLMKIFSCVVLTYNKENYDKLLLVGPYITWGYASKKTINSLVTKRGNAYQNKELKELSNSEIEQTLGKFNVICIEDIIYELSSVLSANRELVMNYIGFFLLSPTETVKENAIKPYYKGGNTGFRGERINDLISLMI